MDTALSFILYPEISFADALSLGEFCSVKDRNTACLTRESVVRGFDQGLKAAGMLELLEELSGNRLDPNLGWALKEWESRYDGVSLSQGIILTLAEDRRYLAEAWPVSTLIRKILAPGVYLLSCDEKAEASEALEKAGVDIVAQPKAGKNLPGKQINSFQRTGLAKESPLSPLSPSGVESADMEPESAGSIQEKFRAVLEKMVLSKQEREELEARIERRLVLSESQLNGASVRYEKLEARGLDYAGKLSIAKQALATGSLLEIFWSGRGAERRCVGVPQALEKKEGESILVIRESGDAPGDMGKETENIRIPLGKISFIKRIKPSIFGEGGGSFV
jgi:hypothetical protein